MPWGHVSSVLEGNMCHGQHFCCRSHPHPCRGHEIPRDTKISVPCPSALWSHIPPSLCNTSSLPSCGPMVPMSLSLRNVKLLCSLLSHPMSPWCATPCPLVCHCLSLPCLAVTNGQLQQLSQTSETSSSISSYSSGPPPGTVNGLGTVTPGPPTRTVDVAISTEDGPRRGWARDRAERAMQTEPATEGLQETRRTVRPPELLRDTAIRGQGSREPPGTHPRRTFSHSPKTALLLALSRPRQPITRSQSDLTVAGMNSAPIAPSPKPYLGCLPWCIPTSRSVPRGEAEEEAGGTGVTGGSSRAAPFQDPRQPFLQGWPHQQPDLGTPQP